jgi:multiple sugar transport system permease protein
MSAIATPSARPARLCSAAAGLLSVHHSRARRRGAVIIFPWLFTFWMSAFDWTIGSTPHFVGRQLRLATNQRFHESILHPSISRCSGRAAHPRHGSGNDLPPRISRSRDLPPGVFIMPIMPPVAVALVWTMMFHPQQGVLNYLLSLVGLPPSLWVYSPTLVIPSLVMVEVSAGRLRHD